MPVTVVQLSDTHLRAEPGPRGGHPDPDARLAAVVEAWRAGGRRADLVLLTGDVADDLSAPAYERVAEAVGVLDAPILALRGNHDDPVALADRLGPMATVDLGAWVVVPVDSSRPDQVHGTVDVSAALAAVDGDDRPTVLAIHHPPRSPSTHPWFRLDGADDLLAGLAERPQVKAVVSGHLHEAFTIEGPGQLVLLGAPSTWVPITHDGDRYRFAAGGPTGARVLTLGADGTFATEILEA